MHQTQLQSQNILITGGTGFIGTHLTHSLDKQSHKITIIDNLMNPKACKNLKTLEKYNPLINIIQANLNNSQQTQKALGEVDTVFHLAATPEIRLANTTPQQLYHNNLYATYTLLEQIKNNPKTHTIIYTSSSTVYGDAETTPTPEDYTPLKPISIYGATKLASEALITAYAHTYNKKAIILRLANIVGSNNHHGVIHDFIEKLRRNPHRLEILGDGTQTKSYLHITDCVSAIQTAWHETKNQVDIYNIGSKDQITVTEIARIVTEEMGLENVAFHYTGGIVGGRGWKGDVKNMLLDTTRLKAKGWHPRFSSADAIRKAVSDSLKEDQDARTLASEWVQQQVAS